MKESGVKLAPTVRKRQKGVAIFSVYGIMLKTQCRGRKQLELQQKAEIISEALEDLFGVPTREGAGDVLECLILTILSQNTTDVSRDKGYAVLKERFPTWEDVLHADVKAIEAAIRIVGLGEQKSRTIKNFLTWLKAEYAANSHWRSCTTWKQKKH